MSVYQYKKPTLLDKHKAQEAALGKAVAVEKPKVVKKVEVKKKKKK